MSTTQVLQDEHRIIERVLDCLERLAERCRAEGRLDAGPARDAIEFFRGFADRAHHGKEENHLFPMAEQALTEADKGRLQEAFARVNTEEIGEAERQRLMQIAASLAERCGVAPVA